MQVSRSYSTQPQPTRPPLNSLVIQYGPQKPEIVREFLHHFDQEQNTDIIQINNRMELLRKLARYTHKQLNNIVINAHGNSSGSPILGRLDHGGIIHLKYILQDINNAALSAHNLVLLVCHGFDISENMAFKNDDPDNCFDQIRAIGIQNIFIPDGTIWSTPSLAPWFSYLHQSTTEHTFPDGHRECSINASRIDKKKFQRELFETDTENNAIIESYVEKNKHPSEAERIKLTLVFKKETPLKHLEFAGGDEYQHKGLVTSLPDS